MPGEFNDFIPSPRRKPRRRFVPTTFEEILGEAVEDDAFFDADDVSFAQEARAVAPTRMAVILGTPVESEDPIGVPRPTPAFGAPESVREDQQVMPTMLDRILNEAAQGASRAIAEDGPIGLSPERVANLARRGVFDGDRANSNLPNAVNEFLAIPRGLTEAAISSAATLGDLGVRALDGAVEGAFFGGRQALEELGMSQGMAKRAEREARNFLTFLALGAAATPSGVAALPLALRMRRQRPGFRPLPLGKEMPLTSSAKDFKREIDHVLQTGESSVNQVFRSEFGPITIDFGRPGRGRKSKGGFGLSKIIKKRTVVDGIDGERFVRDQLPEVLARGKLISIRGPDLERRAVIDLGRDRAVLSLFRDEKRETWVLNGFEKFEK